MLAKAPPESLIESGTDQQGFCRDPTGVRGTANSMPSGTGRKSQPSSPDYSVRRAKAWIFSGCDFHPARGRSSR